MANVRLGDVVMRIKDKVNRDNCDLDYYIGGEHFDYGEVLVTKRAEIQGSTIGPAFHMRFHKGDVLLMSRNPHLRKAGMVDFVGLCSDVSYVCRTRDEGVLLQEFLPFLFQTDDFWKFAEANKKGSTNFFLNWSDFEKYEFDLPDIETQRKLSTLLWAMECTKTAYKNLIAKTDELVKSQFVEMFGTFPANEHSWPVGTIRDGVMDVRYGSSRKAAEGNNGQYPYLRMNNITYSGELDLSDVKTIDIPDDELDKCSVRRGDVLFNRTNSRELVGKTCVYNRDELMVLAGFVVRVRVNDRLLPEFLSAFMNTDFTKTLLLSMCKAAIGQANINATEFQNIGIYFPPIEHQQEFVQMKAQADKSKFAAQQALADLTATQKALMRQYLG